MIGIAASEADEIPFEPFDGNLVGLLFGLDGRQLVLREKKMTGEGISSTKA